MMQLVDRPLVKAETFRAMMDAGGKAVVIPSFGGRRGHPVFFPPQMRDILLSLQEGETIGDGIRKWSGETVILPVEDPAVLWNIDTPEALEKYGRI